MIRGIVIAAYLGWIAFGAVSILIPATPKASTSAFPVHVAATAVLGGFWALFAKQRSPWSFYVYIIFPCYFWDQVFARASMPLLNYLKQGSMGSVAGYIVRGALVVAALQSMVVRVHKL